MYVCKVVLFVGDRYKREFSSASDLMFTFMSMSEFTSISVSSYDFTSAFNYVSAFEFTFAYAFAFAFDVFCAAFAYL